MEKYGRFPCDDCWLSQGFKSNHKAIDLGWLKKFGKNRPVKAWKSGVVVATGTDSAGGVYVVLKHDDVDCTWITRYWHFVKGSVKVAKGQTVTQGQVLGTRGNTGISSGVHLHFEVWKCKKGYSYKSGDCSKYAVDPMKYTYVYEGQTVDEDKAVPKPAEVVVPKTVTADATKHQVEVIATNLRVRTSPSLQGACHCTCKKGLYDVLDIKTADGYDWFCIETDRWIATKEGDWTINKPLLAVEPDTTLVSVELEKLMKELELYKKALETTETTLQEALKAVQDVRGAFV